MRIILLSWLLLLSTHLSAAILDLAELPEASPDLMQQDLSTFESIEQGLVLMLAGCGDATLVCSVSATELEELIVLVDQRIASLNSAEVQPMLAAYTRLRDNYATHLETLQGMAQQDLADELIADDDALLDAAEQTLQSDTDNVADEPSDLAEQLMIFDEDEVDGDEALLEDDAFLDEEL